MSRTGRRAGSRRCKASGIVASRTSSTVSSGRTRCRSRPSANNRCRIDRLEVEVAVAKWVSVLHPTIDTAIAVHTPPNPHPMPTTQPPPPGPPLGPAFTPPTPHPMPATQPPPPGPPFGPAFTPPKPQPLPATQPPPPGPLRSIGAKRAAASMSTTERVEVASAAAVGARIAVAMTPTSNSDVRKLHLLRILQKYATSQRISMPLT